MADLSFTDRAARLFGLNRDSPNFRKRLDRLLKQVGIRTLDSNNDIRKIKTWLEANPRPQPEPEPAPEPIEPDIPPKPENPNNDARYQELLDQLKIQQEKFDKSLADQRAASEKRFENIQEQNRNYIGELTSGFQSQYARIADEMKIMGEQAATREAGFRDQLTAMNQERLKAEQDFQRQYQEQQTAFDTAQRVSASNMARGGQQTDYRLGPGANAMRGGTAGFRRRSKPLSLQIGAAGFASGNNNTTTAKTLNV